MQRLEVSGAVRPIYGSLGVKGLIFIMLSSRLSVIHTICLHFHFSVSRPDMGGIYYSSISFVYKWSHWMFIARAMCGLTSVIIIALCSGRSLLCVLKQWLSNREWSWTLARIVANTVQLWLQLFSNYNKTPVHSTWGLLRVCVCVCVCATCPTPRLNLSSELRPSWNNIQDMFLTGSATDTRIGCLHSNSSRPMWHSAPTTGKKILHHRTKHQPRPTAPHRA